MIGIPKTRVSWDEYFLQIAKLVATRSTCTRRNVGSVLVRDNRILATGYNGAPSGLAHCKDTGCEREQMLVPSGQRHEICRAVHAEQNVLAQCAKYGISTNGSTLYVTHQPCILCAKQIINAGIVRIVFSDSYPDVRSLDILTQANIEMKFLEIIEEEE